MFGVELRQLALPGVLKGIGRRLREEFLARFHPDLGFRPILASRTTLTETSSLIDGLRRLGEFRLDLARVCLE